MGPNLNLFDEVPALRSELAARLGRLREQGVWIGGSSWKYEGWLGQIYTEERYQTRGRFSRKKFEAECLNEYAEVFPVVCGDFSFYQFPSQDYWQKLFAGSPGHLHFGFKVPEMITVKTWPSHARYGARGGQENEAFLNAELFRNPFCRPLEAYQERVSVLIFEFGTFSKRQMETPQEFVDNLDSFLRVLPPGFRYAVEIRNKEYLDAPYFDCLRAHNTAHVFNAWTRMPELGTQIEMPGAFTADFTVTRALLRHGRAYAAAVESFEPYRAVQEENPGARDAMRRLIERSKRTKQVAFMFVNNRLEGNAPGTIHAVTAGE